MSTLCRFGGTNRSAGSLTASYATDTEFSAEIVRIVSIEPHPNADRLEIARFEMVAARGVPSSYRVVTGKGDFRPGDLAAYFSVDCLLPTSHPAFAFLTKRPDGNKPIFRLKAARLRGVFSQGLLVPAPAGLAFGDGCATAFGVTYHRDPEDDTRGQSPRSAARQPFPVYTVDSLKKLPALIEPGEFVVVTEKIHGTNFRFGWVRRKILGIPFGWRFVVGSHRAIKSGSDGGFYGENLWSDAAERMKLADATRDYRGFTFYGELYGYTYGGKPIQDLTYDCNPSAGPSLAIFDIRTPEGTWLTPFAVRCACADTGLELVPVLYSGHYDEAKIRELAEGPSELAPRQMREGCVVEAVVPRRKAKYVGEGYLLRKQAA